MSKTEKNSLHIHLAGNVQKALDYVLQSTGSSKRDVVEAAILDMARVYYRMEKRGLRLVPTKRGSLPITQALQLARDTPALGGGDDGEDIAVPGMADGAGGGAD